MDLSAVVAEMSDILREMIGANIALQLNLEREGLWVKADAGLIEQVVVNLISNARDAMPQGGSITVETSRVNVDEDFLKRKAAESVGPRLPMPPPAPPEGNCVRLLVRDIGTGMDAATKAMIFMPFWTTKEVGNGEGLGLCFVYGVVKNGGGGILVESELGRGACFEVYLPEIPAPVGQREDLNRTNS
ncbi:MAG: ATP-binding protein [Terriglobales bacterium]|jgi:two-component system, cell cycle sensor histidine kinase and response regulator CckA